MWVKLWVGVLDTISSNLLNGMAGTTGLEPAASAVTGQRSNQLNYVPTRQINEMRNRQCLCDFAQIAYSAWNCLRCTKERGSCPNRPQISAFRALLRFPKHPAQSAPGDPEFCQSGQNHQQNYRKSLSQKYPNSFSQNTKDHLDFPGSDGTKFSNSAATVVPVVCATEQRPLPRRVGGPALIVRSRGIVSIS